MKTIFQLIISILKTDYDICVVYFGVAFSSKMRFHRLKSKIKYSTEK